LTQSPAEKFFWRKDPTADTKQTRDLKTVQKSSSEDQPEAIAKPDIRSSAVLVGIPCHNSQAEIGSTVVRLLPLGSDIVICDDGSTDSTEEIAARMGCGVIKHPRELGRSDSVTSLYLAAKKLRAEALLTVGVDSKFTLTDASRLIDAVQKDDVDIAIGSAYSLEAVDKARHEGVILDSQSLFRAYGKRALAMISPAGTGSVVVEKEVLEFANQQGLRIREYPTTSGAVKTASTLPAKKAHFESRYFDYVTEKHPLIFLGIPSVGFLYGAVVETTLNADFTGSITSVAEKFVLSLASSPLFITSVALSIGTAILYSHKKILAKINSSNQQKIERL
jgi:glycosyltransferase involved in cell wall biosynthesis